LEICQKTNQDTENMEDLQGITLDVRKTNICTFFSYFFERSDSKPSL